MIALNNKEVEDLKLALTVGLKALITLEKDFGEDTMDSPLIIQEALFMLHNKKEIL